MSPDECTSPLQVLHLFPSCTIPRTLNTTGQIREVKTGMQEGRGWQMAGKGVTAGQVGVAGSQLKGKLGHGKR